MQKEFWRYSSRGRRPSSVDSYKDRKAIEYLAILALKYKIGSSEFFECVLKAWKQEKAKCRKLNIVCRQKTGDSAIFLFSISQDVISQFSIPTSIFQRKNPLENYIRMISVTASRADIINPKIEDLKAGMKQINLKAKVIEIPEPNKVYTRSGVEAQVSNALISDETGTIRMSLWNRQINTISKGDIIKIQNGTVTRFRGDLQLRIGKSGELSIIE
jgi:replication factor A1